MKPKVGVIIVNYNGTGLLRNCLQALEKQSLGNFEEDLSVLIKSPLPTN